MAWRPGRPGRIGTISGKPGVPPNRIGGAVTFASGAEVKIDPGACLVVQFNTGATATISGRYRDGTLGNPFSSGPITFSGSLFEGLKPSAADPNVTWDTFPDTGQIPMAPPAAVSSGLPKVVASAIEVYAEGNLQSTICTWTVGAEDGLFEVGGNLFLNGVASGTFWVELDYTDEAGNVWSYANGNGFALYDYTLATAADTGIAAQGGGGETADGTYPLIPYTFTARAGSTITLLVVAGQVTLHVTPPPTASGYIEQKA